MRTPPLRNGRPRSAIDRERRRQSGHRAFSSGAKGGIDLTLNLVESALDADRDRIAEINPGVIDVGQAEGWNVVRESGSGAALR